MRCERRVDNFLFWGLDTGVYIIAYIQMIAHMFTWISFVTLAAFVYQMDMQRLQHETHVTVDQLKHLRSILPIVVLFETVELIMCGTLLAGLYEQNPEKVMTWLAHSEIITLIRFVLNTFKSILVLISGQISIGTASLIKSCLDLGIQVYIMVVVYSYYTQMPHKN